MSWHSRALEALKSQADGKAHTVAQAEDGENPDGEKKHQRRKNENIVVALWEAFYIEN